MATDSLFVQASVENGTWHKGRRVRRCTKLQLQVARLIGQVAGLYCQRMGGVLSDEGRNLRRIA